jgi:hypothetical protein
LTKQPGVVLKEHQMAEFTSTPAGRRATDQLRESLRAATGSAHQRLLGAVGAFEALAAHPFLTKMNDEFIHEKISELRRDLAVRHLYENEPDLAATLERHMYVVETRLGRPSPCVMRARWDETLRASFDASIRCDVRAGVLRIGDPVFCDGVALGRVTRLSDGYQHVAEAWPGAYVYVTTDARVNRAIPRGTMLSS